MDMANIERFLLSYWFLLFEKQKQASGKEYMRGRKKKVNENRK